MSILKPPPLVVISEFHQNTLKPALFETSRFHDKANA